MQAGNWRATPATSSNIGGDPNTSLSPLPIEQVFTRVPSRRTENALGISRWIWLWILTTTPYSQSWSVPQHALHDQTCPWEKSEPLAKAVRRLLPYKKHIKTITTDNCPEFAAHKLITKYLGAVVYFADPYASWQKGAIENTNKLIRQYIPKHTNFDDITNKKIASIQKKINSRPRGGGGRLKFKTLKIWFLKRRV